MIVGECPYSCGQIHMIPLAPHCPAFSKEECEGCGKEFWLLHSRLDPQAFTLEDFAVKYEVDEETKHITKRKVLS